jgi:ribosomal protein L37AE/L43A
MWSARMVGVASRFGARPGASASVAQKSARLAAIG